MILVLDETGLYARLSPYFGRAPYFAVIDVNERGEVIDQKTVPTSVSISAEPGAHPTESCN